MSARNLAAKQSSENFQVRFFVKLDDSFNRFDFFKTQKKFESNAAIQLFNSSLKDTGELISVDEHESSTELSWLYTFRDRQSFINWEKQLYSRGMVCRENRPYTIHREYIQS